MTLQDIFDSIADNPTFIIIYFIAIPLLTALFAWIGYGEANRSPWKYIYSTLIYLSSVPGIFAITVSVFTFLFVRTSFLNVNVLVYFLPVISMVATFMILKRVVNLDDIPGFGKLSGLLMTIFAIILVMFILDRTRIIAFVMIPVQYLILIMVLLFFMFRIGMKRVMNS
ncbi:MAG: hypothetical protein ACI94Y_002687 [Maribacter sp.]|jgi:hypothetical protein